MPITPGQMKEQGFACDAYPPCDRLGAWEAKVIAAVYSNGSRVHRSNRAAWAGIHLYVQADNDSRKHWLFVYNYLSSEVYQCAKQLNAGDYIRLGTEFGKYGHMRIVALEKLE